jgi:Pyruvate/2-oxoacid:ferredoxin oxidoreductase gamma subunit
LGSVYAEMRVRENSTSVLGPGIPEGALDGLVAMDPWEALRHLHLAHHNTQLYVETEVMPLFGDRKSEDPEAMQRHTPIERLQKLPIPINWKNYRQHAEKATGTTRMANYFAGLDCLSILNLCDTRHYHEVFYREITGAASLSFESL